MVTKFRQRSTESFTCGTIIHFKAKTGDGNGDRLLESRFSARLASIQKILKRHERASDIAEKAQVGGLRAFICNDGGLPKNFAELPNLLPNRGVKCMSAAMTTPLKDERESGNNEDTMARIRTINWDYQAPAFAQAGCLFSSAGYPLRL